MTPAEEERIIVGVIDGIEADLQDALRDVVSAIVGGADPRAAVMQASERFTGEMEAAMVAALREILADAVGDVADVAIIVGRVSLSSLLWSEAQATSEVVRGIVQRQVDGFGQARDVARELYEGYAFRDPSAEPLQLSPSNERLPLYLRDAVLTDHGVAGQLERAYAQLQIDGLSTPALQAAYQEVLDAIDRMENGPAGRRMLQRKLDVAFYERMRYMASRIARTELHRAYAEREARILVADDAVQFVEIRRAPGRDDPCICELMAGRDVYGLGGGVYPKAAAPVPPFHPHCMCSMVGRLDLSGKEPTEPDEDADAYFLSRVGQTTAGRIMGSKAKAEDVLAGKRTAEEVANASRDINYRIRRVGDVVPQ